MDRTSRWETEALRRRVRRSRPRPGHTTPTSSPAEPAAPAHLGATGDGALTQPSAPVPAAPEEVQADPEPGTVIVPVDAWTRMLDQLGNLHEAGQQLADARERAAKAETQVEFLRERLAEYRTRVAELSEPEPTPGRAHPQEPGIDLRDAPTPAAVATAVVGSPEVAPSHATTMWTRAARRVRGLGTRARRI